MDWKEFKSMPDDLKITYIKAVREKYGVSDTQLGKAMGTNPCSFSNEMSRLGLNVGVGKRNSATKWDKEGFLAWWHGVDKLPTPVIEEEPVHEAYFEIPDYQEREGIPNSDTFTEDDLPFEEPDPAPVDDFAPFPVRQIYATPCNGSMQFTCPANQALNTLAQILGSTNCAISVMWRVIEEGGVEDGKA
jgi:hypothetical protein